MDTKVTKALGMTALAAMLAACGSTEIREVPAPVEPAAPAADLHALSLGETGRLVGEVSLRNDAQSLLVTVTAHEGLHLRDVRVCLGTSAFRWLAPESCGYVVAPDGTSGKATLAIALADLGEPVVGDVLYVQAAASILENGAEAGYAYAGTFKGRVGYTVSGGAQDATGACVLSATDWAGEKEELPLASLDLGAENYRKDELADLLARHAAGDASVLLAQQVIAARFNAARGVALPVGVAAALDASDAWFAGAADGDGSLPFAVLAAPGIEANSEAFDDGVNAAEMIRQFNAGKLAVPACE